MAKVLKKKNYGPPIDMTPGGGSSGRPSGMPPIPMGGSGKPAGMPPIPMGGGGKPAGMPPIPKTGGGTQVLKGTPTLWDKARGLATEAYTTAKQKATPILKQFRESNVGKSLQKGVKNVKTAVMKEAKNPKVKTATKAIRNVGTAGGLARLGAAGVAFGAGYGAGTLARKELDRRGFPGFDTPYKGQLPKDIERQGAEMAAPGIRAARKRNRANEAGMSSEIKAGTYRSPEGVRSSEKTTTTSTTTTRRRGGGTQITTRRRGTTGQGTSRNVAPAKTPKRTAVTKTQKTKTETTKTPSSNGVSMNTAVALTAGGIALGMLLKSGKKQKKTPVTRPGNTYKTNYYFK